MLLHQKPNTPKMIYLDQFQWINISLAYYQNPRGTQFTQVLQLLQSALDRKLVRFPISDSHIIETMKNGDIARRKRLAHVMAELSQGWTIAPLQAVTPQELNPALSIAFHKPIVFTSPVVFGQGIEFALGAPIHAPRLIQLLNSSDERKKNWGIRIFEMLLAN